MPAPAVLLLLGGGCAYVVGVVFFVLGSYKPIYHVIWHIFVMLGAALHWFDVYFFIVNTNVQTRAMVA
jgi:hemolysin III